MDLPSFITTGIDDHTLAINPGQTLDNNNAYDMVESLTAAQADGYTVIIIDMAELEFISSAGVGAILGTVESFRERGGDIILCNASPAILHVLQILDLTEYLTLCPDLPRACERSRMGSQR